VTIEAEAARPSRAQIWISASRPKTLPAAVAPVIVGSALAAHDHRFDPGAAVLCLGFALLVQIGTNFANYYHDFIHGADTAARVGPRRAVASGLVAPRVMWRATVAVFAAAFLLGLGLIHWGGPWPLGYHGFGDLFVFIFFGLVAVDFTYFVQAGAFSGSAILAGTSIGLLGSNILLVNNYRDAETDAVARKRTLVVRFGRRFARIQFAASLAGALLIPLLLVARGFGPGCLLPLLTAPLAWSHIRRLENGRTPAQHVALLGATGRYIAIYAVLLAAGILV
jgi:1,4-dihydroxy-2-naphthoate polyprenyltransferase